MPNEPSPIGLRRGGGRVGVEAAAAALRAAAARADRAARDLDATAVARRAAEQRLCTGVAVPGDAVLLLGSVDRYERAIAEFQAALRMSEELLLLLTHGVRGPLTVIKGRAQRLRRQALASGHPDRALIHELDEIDGAVDRLVRLLDGAMVAPPDRAADSAEPGGV